MTVAGLDEQMSLDEYRQWKVLYQLERSDPPWTRTEEFLATLIEEVSAGLLRLAWLQIGKKTPIPGRPTQIRRSTHAEEQDSRNDAARAMAIFQSLGKEV